MLRRGHIAGFFTASYTPRYFSTMASRLPSGSRPNDAKAGPAGEPMTPILSASLVVLTPSSSSTSPVSTLMLQRSARMGSSFRSAVVFPGGALDLADEAAVGCPSDVSNLDDVGRAEYRRALQLCALRETFEETGLLLLPSKKQTAGAVPFSRAVGAKEAGLSPKEWARRRDEVHEDAARFPDFLASVARHVGIQLDAPPTGSIETTSDYSSPLPLVGLAYHSHWITPRSVVRPGKRFSAHFFLTILDDETASSGEQQSSRDELPSLALSADGTETLSLKVAPIDDFIDATLRDEILLYPPQFYILADLFATMTMGVERGVDIGERAKRLAPLAFGGQARRSATDVTPVEEEPRGLAKGTNYAWDRETERPTGWVSPPRGSGVTAVEPHALPKQGGTVSLKFEKRPNTLSSSASAGNEDDDEDTPFVFPLVLPGDWQASSSQRRAAGGGEANDAQAPNRPLNRIYVSPRNPENGGGLIARGARRRGVAGLMDWKVGFELEEAESVEQEDEEEEPRSRTKARM